MILTCPACHKRYLIDVRSLATERVVRCATCNHTWRQTAMKEKSTLENDSLEVTLSDIPYNQGKETENLSILKKPFPLGWTIYGLIWSLIFVITIIAREPLIISFPPLYKIYRSLGIIATPPGYGFKIENVFAIKKYYKGKAFFTIEGQIINSSAQVKLLTPLHIVYKPSDNCQNIAKLVNTHSFNENAVPSCKNIHWSFTLPQDRLLSGERILFETTLPSEPPPHFKGIIHF